MCDTFGRHIAVVGGASGIGLSCAEPLAERSARVVLVDREVEGQRRSRTNGQMDRDGHCGRLPAVGRWLGRDRHELTRRERGADRRFLADLWWRQAFQGSMSMTVHARSSFLQEGCDAPTHVR